MSLKENVDDISNEFLNLPYSKKKEVIDEINELINGKNNADQDAALNNYKANKENLVTQLTQQQGQPAQRQQGRPAQRQQGRPAQRQQPAQRPRAQNVEQARVSQEKIRQAERDIARAQNVEQARVSQNGGFTDAEIELMVNEFAVRIASILLALLLSDPSKPLPTIPYPTGHGDWFKNLDHTGWQDESGFGHVFNLAFATHPSITMWQKYSARGNTTSDLFERVMAKQKTIFSAGEHALRHMASILRPRMPLTFVGGAPMAGGASVGELNEMNRRLAKIAKCDADFAHISEIKRILKGYLEILQNEKLAYLPKSMADKIIALVQKDDALLSEYNTYLQKVRFYANALPTRSLDDGDEHAELEVDGDNKKLDAYLEKLDRVLETRKLTGIDLACAGNSLCDLVKEHKDKLVKSDEFKALFITPFPSVGSAPIPPSLITSSHTAKSHGSHTHPPSHPAGPGLRWARSPTMGWIPVSV